MSLAEGEIALIGEVEPAEDFRGEVLRVEQQLRIRRFLVVTLWLMASLLLHLRIILILGNVNLFSASRPARRIVVVNTRVVDALEREPLPPPPLKVADIPLPPTTLPPEQVAAEKMAQAAKQIAPLPVPDIKTIEVEGLLAPPVPSRWRSGRRWSERPPRPAPPWPWSRLKNRRRKTIFWMTWPARWLRSFTKSSCT